MTLPRLLHYAHGVASGQPWLGNAYSTTEYDTTRERKHWWQALPFGILLDEEVHMHDD